jgi:hypothetical protein
MAAASKSEERFWNGAPFPAAGECRTAVFDSRWSHAGARAIWACQMPGALMLDEDAGHREVDAIIKAAKLRVEASRLARAVEDATFRLKMALDASRRAQTAVREVLSLPPDLDPDDDE